MISFPATGVFAGLGGVGVSMFFVTCVSYTLFFLLYSLYLQGYYIPASVLLWRQWICRCKRQYDDRSCGMTVKSLAPSQLSPCLLAQPFFHILANDIARIVGEDKPHEIISTTILAFALSSLLTGTSTGNICARKRLTRLTRSDVLSSWSAPIGFAHWILPPSHPSRVSFSRNLLYRFYSRAALRCIGGVGVFLIITG